MNTKLLTLLSVVLMPACGNPVFAAEGVPETKAKTVRLLTVGNSFSQNATHFLGKLATAAGHVLVHHQAAIGGATVAQHWEKAEQYEKDPEDKRGLYTTRRSLKQELVAEPWDFVTIQQASIRSHDVATYRPYASQLRDYVKKHAPGAELLLHQTWEYRRDDPRFAAKSPKPGEPATQEAMYQGLTHAYEAIAAELGVRLIPVGDAFHLADTDPKWGYQPDTKFDFKNARQPALPDQTHSLHVGWHWAKEDGKSVLRMDGHHASAAGEYLGACVFYEVLFGESAVGNSFVPPDIEPAYARFLQETAHQAVTKSRARKKAAALVPSAAPLARATTPLSTVDLSSDTGQQVVVAQGTKEVYQGHPTTLLLPDGKTMFCVWTLGHGGTCGPMKRSDDGGKTWSELLPTPENWKEVRNCPALYRLTDPKGVARLFVFAGRGPDGKMQQAHSIDEGKTWTPMTSTGLACVMPFCTIVPVDGGKRLIGLTTIRRSGEVKDKLTNIVVQSQSTDGGLTWGPWRVVLDLDELKPCEPAVVRSPDEKQLLCLLRENVRKAGGHYMTSNDEGRTWSAVKPLPPGLHGDRFMARYAPDGRLVVCFRDMGQHSGTRGHFVAWVGRYEDIVNGRDGQYRIKLLHSHAGSDCGYPGLELLPDQTFVATTYIKYRPGPEKQSVVSTRFKLSETDKLATKAPAPGAEEQEPGNQPAGHLD